MASTSPKSPKSPKSQTVPFWCRTDPGGRGTGIMYKAHEKIGTEYICEGSRKVGNIDDKSVWVFGGYIDNMNSAGIKEILHTEVKKLSPKQKRETIKKIDGIDLSTYDGYYDDESYWFYQKPKHTKSKKKGGRKSRKNRK